jgi:outer membrane protein assembly factor BamE (lipoprotein component of BamABCDE complex)
MNRSREAADLGRISFALAAPFLLVAISCNCVGSQYTPQATSAGSLAREAEMRVSLLRPGMTQEQVLFVLGAAPSVITGAADAGTETWDYWYFPPDIEYESHMRLSFNSAGVYTEGKVGSLLTHYELRAPEPRHKVRVTASPESWYEVGQLMWSLPAGATLQEVENALAREASGHLRVGRAGAIESYVYWFFVDRGRVEGVAAFNAEGRMLDGGVKSFYFEDIVWGSAFRSEEDFRASALAEAAEVDGAPSRPEQERRRSVLWYGYGAASRTIFIPSSFQISWTSQDTDGDGVPDAWIGFTRLAKPSDAGVATKKETTGRLKALAIWDRNEDGLQDRVVFFYKGQEPFRELVDIDFDGFFDVETFRRSGVASSRAVHMRAAEANKQPWW